MEGVFLGVDFHARTQTVSWCDTANGIIERRTLDHRTDDVRAFYQQFHVPAVVGLEATGYARWFHRLVEETGHRLVIGDALRIRQFAARRQKNDRRDSELLLDLLLRGDFPAIHIPSIASQEVLRLLRYRHRLVGMRTMLKNGLQAVMLSNRVLRTSRMRTLLWPHQLEKLPLTGADAIRREHSLPLMDELSARIEALEDELQRRSQGDSAVTLLQTHPGVGLLTALAVAHTLQPLDRFRRTRCVAAYCGLDPVERSSGDTVRFGHISKQGNRLLRFLLIEAGRSAVRPEGDPHLRRFYYQLALKRNGSIAAVAVARKLLLRLFCMLRDQIDYEEFRRRGRDARCARGES
jgi:transposase